MPDLFTYTDYRAWLKAYYLDRKSQSKFSYEQFAKELGFSERSFVQHLVAGKRDLSELMLPQVLQALNLNAQEEAYFRLLHKFATAKSAESKQQLWQEIRTHLKETRSDVPMASQRLELLNQWYAFPIKELLCLGVKTDLEIRQALCLQVSLEEVRSMVAELIRLDFVRLREDGTFEDLEPEISAPTQSEFSQAIHQYQMTMQKLGHQLMHLAEADRREIQTLTMPLSQAGFDQARQVLRRARDEMIAIYQEDSVAPKNALGVFQFNLNLFPLALIDRDPPEKGGVE